MADFDVTFNLDEQTPVNADFSLGEHQSIEANFSIDVKNGDHNLLFNRDLADQHPIKAITGLEDSLTSLSNDISAEENRAKGVEQDLANSIDSNHQEISNHVSDKNNPHEVTKTQIGLGDVDNTSDINKPISTATQNALNGKVDKVNTASRVYGTDASGNQTTYDSQTFGKVDDVQVGGVSVVTNKVAELGTMAGEDSSDYYTSGQVDTALASKQDVISDISTIRSNAQDGKTAYTTIQSYGNIVTHNANEFASAQQGSLADTALQPNDNISQLTNNVGYITSSSVKDGTLTIQKNGSSLGTFTANQSTNTTINVLVPTDTSDLTNNAGFITGITSSDVTGALGYTPYDATNPDDFQTGTEVASAIAVETGNRQSADSSLQSQIDDLKARGRFLALWNCSTGLAETNPPLGTYTYQSGDYFIVGVVSTANPPVNYKPDGSSYTTGVASTVVETSSVDVDDVYYYDGTNWRLQVNTQKTVAFVNIAGDPYDNTNLATALNTKVDSSSLATVATSGSYTDLSNTPTIPTVNNGTLTIQKNGTNVQTFTANQSTNSVANITVPTDTVELTNGAGFITGITSGDVTTALGYTPVNPTSLSTVATSGDYDDLTNKPTIPTVNDATLTIQKNGTNIATFTSNSATATTANITVPTDTSDLTNGAGYITGITSGDVTGALGYTPIETITTGSANGSISVDGSNVFVYGLGSAAYTSSSNYATSAQGSLADTAVQPSDLATVATTGDYDDLLNKPTIPAAQVNSDWNAVSGVAEILNKPTIPTVNNATLTLTQGGTTKGTFTANASSDVTIDLDAGGSSLPSQTGNSGKLLTTDGTDASWTSFENVAQNASTTAKETIIGWGIPDYDSGISVTIPSQSNPYVASVPCLVTLNAVSSGGNDYVYINGHALPNQGSTAFTTFPYIIFLDAGDSIYCSAGIQNAWIVFPLKGVRNA